VNGGVTENEGLEIYDLSTKTKSSLGSYGSLFSPDVYENIIISDMNYDAKFWMYDFSTKSETVITTSEGVPNPRIYGNKIVWGNSIYDLSTNSETQITTSGSASNPVIYEDRIVWQDNRNGDSDIYMATLSSSNLPETVEAEIYFSPDTLNLGSGGQWVTVYIELPEEYAATGIDVSSVLLNGAVSAVTDKKYNFVTDEREYLTDIDRDGISERMLKFDRKAIEFILKAGDQVTITLTGKVECNNGISSSVADFKGSDVIRVIKSDSKKKVEQNNKR
jgi:beta propeller repeat protein